MTDTTTMNGAQFRRHTGTDPERWAAAFLAAYAQAGADGVRTDADRLAFVAQWFRDAQEAAVAEAVGPATATERVADVLKRAVAASDWDQVMSVDELRSAARAALRNWEAARARHEDRS